MRYFCTYFDGNYLVQGLALHASLKRYCPKFRLDILCLDEECRMKLARLSLPDCRLISLADLEIADGQLPLVKANRTLVEYYFTITPALIRHLVGDVPEGEILTYLDADLYFFTDPAPLFEELRDGSIGIIPHRFPPQSEYLSMHGKYNVGWVSFRNDERARACLGWWRDCCLEWCHARVEGDRYADQGYLNDWPERFPGTVVIQNQGADVAPWNVGQHQFERGSTGVTVQTEGH